MAEIKSPQKVKLICGMIGSRRELLLEAADLLADRYSPVDLASEFIPFEHTGYYASEMGEGLLKYFVSFEQLIDPADLAAVKIATNELEALFAERVGHNPARPVNLDPGYIAPSKLVLASMKDFSHRIYLTGGVYAEVTMQWRAGAWQHLAWTFPDFASGRYDQFLTAARDKLREVQTQGAC